MTAALDLLARADKWHLSAGEGLIWAPPFPAWLDVPGFWDEAHLFEHAIRPLFTVAFVDEHGREVPLRALAKRWTPASLDVSYAPGAGFELVESRMVLPGFVLGSEWQVANVGPSRAKLHAVAWTIAPGEDVGPGDVTHEDGVLSWHRTLKDAPGDALAVELQLAMARGADSWGAVRADRTADRPLFALTPFWDRWDPRAGGLPGGIETGAGATRRSVVFLGVHRALVLEPGAAVRLAVALRLVPNVSRGAAPKESAPAHRASSFAAASRAGWESWFAALPAFRCADPYFERAWAYRWFGLRLNAIQAGWGNYVAPTVAAGIGEMHRPLCGVAPALARELRWHPDPEWARGVLLTFLRHRRPDGALPARVGAIHLDPGSPLGDWGGAVRALDAVHPSDEFLREALPALERYAEWLLNNGDGDGSGLMDVPGGGGPEDLAQRQAPDAPEGAAPLRPKGVDATVLFYQLCRALEALGARGGVEPARWREQADKTGAALMKKMWDPRAGAFADLSSVTGRRVATRSVVAFYPYLTDLVSAPQFSGLVQTLFDPRQFWKPFPVASLSGKDPLYDADGTLNGRRLERPWTGRVWPIANCHIAEAVANLAIHHLPALRSHLVELVTKTVRMMFWDGDVQRPNSFEHYHPVSGRPSAYRGLDDQLHSWIVDLIVQYVIGLRVSAPGRCVVDPMPFPLDGFEATGLPVQGALVDVRREGEQLHVKINGREAAKGRLGEPIELSL